MDTMDTMDLSSIHWNKIKHLELERNSKNDQIRILSSVDTVDSSIQLGVYCIEFA